ncbi:MAG TPA: TIGR02452 family protein [Chlamydiales bacterium]|nr:TIGR02452 family protein [Chlamydiales bacterium]
MVSSVVSFVRSLPDPSVQRRYAPHLSILSGAGLLLNIARGAFFSWSTALMIAGIAGGIKARWSISLTSRIEYLHKELIKASVKEIDKNLISYQGKLRELGLELKQLPSNQKTQYMLQATNAMFMLLTVKPEERRARLAALKAVPTPAPAKIAAAVKPVIVHRERDVSEVASLPKSPKINDPFVAWLKNNRRLNDNARSLIMHAYEKAINSSNPDQVFYERIGELERDTFITQANGAYSLIEFQKVRALPRPLIRSGSSPFIEFDPGKWSGAYRALPRTLDPKTLRAKKGELLGIIRDGTLDALKAGKYRVHGNTVPLSDVLTSRMKKGTRLYPAAPPLILGDRFKDTKIQVIDSDVIDAAMKAKEKGYSNPVFIDMACYNNPCGAFLTNSPAGEENIARRSNLSDALFREKNPDFYTRSKMQKGYHIPRGGAIYIPHLQVFRGNEASGYPFLEDPVELASIAIAAPDLNPDHYKGKTLPCKPLSHEHFQWLDLIIEAFLSVAYNNGHDALVLSAIGCGAYNNDPKLVTSRFSYILGQPRWRGKFGSVCFAILGKGKNLDAFNVLNGHVLGVPNSKPLYRG